MFCTRPTSPPCLHAWPCANSIRPSTPHIDSWWAGKREGVYVEGSRGRNEVEVGGGAYVAHWPSPEGDTGPCCWLLAFADCQ